VPTFLGKPVSDKETDCDDPLLRVKVTEAVEVPPACTIPEAGETPIEKSNDGELTVNVNWVV
jgi:hypothetical protein